MVEAVEAVENNAIACMGLEAARRIQ